jgi:hypothetical protein
LPNFSEVATANRENLRDLTEANPTLLRDWVFAPPHIPQFLAVTRSSILTSNIPAANPGADYQVMTIKPKMRYRKILGMHLGGKIGFMAVG